MATTEKKPKYPNYRDLIKLIEAIAENCEDVALDFKADGGRKMYNTLHSEYRAYRDVIRLITEPEHFSKLWEIMFGDGWKEYV